MWIAGTTHGHGHHEPYGRFYDAGERWLAHRWSAKNIHGLEIEGQQVDHCCPAGASTLCVEHVKPESAEMNRYLQHARPGRASQAIDTKRYWVHVQVGLETDDRYKAAREARAKVLELEIPFFSPPRWLLPFMPAMEIFDDCPF